MSECVIKGPQMNINWLVVAAFRYAVCRHTTQSMWGIENVILDNLDVLTTEFIKQFVRDIKREQYATEVQQNFNKRDSTDYFARLKGHIEDYQRDLKNEKGEKAQELYKLLCQVMELIPEVDMTHKWDSELWRRVDDTSYLTPMLNRLEAELKKREEQQDGQTNR